MKDISQRLAAIAEAEEIKATDDLLEEIASRVQGGLRDAVMLLDQVRRVGIYDRAGFRSLFGINDVSEALMTAAIKGDLVEGSQLIGEQYRRTGDVQSMATDLTLLVRDLLVIRAGGTPDQSPEKLAARKVIAETTNSRALVRAIGVLWDLKARVRGFEHDQRASMEMAFVLLSEALQPKERVQETIRAVTPVRQALSLSEVQARLSV